MLDLGRRELVGDDGVAVPLSTGEFRLLCAFLEHPGMVLTPRPAARPHARAQTPKPFDRSIDNQVSRLRKKIERDPKNPDADQDALGRRL